MKVYYDAHGEPGAWEYLKRLLRWLFFGDGGGPPSAPAVVAGVGNTALPIGLPIPIPQIGGFSSTVDPATWGSLFTGGITPTTPPPSGGVTPSGALPLPIPMPPIGTQPLTQPSLPAGTGPTTGSTPVPELHPYASPFNADAENAFTEALRSKQGTPLGLRLRALFPGYLGSLELGQVVAPPKGVYVKGQPYVPAGPAFLPHLVPSGETPPVISMNRVTPYGSTTVPGYAVEGSTFISVLDVDMIAAELDRREQDLVRGNSGGTFSGPHTGRGNPNQQTPLRLYLMTGEPSHLWALYGRLTPPQPGKGFSLKHRVYGLPYDPTSLTHPANPT